MLRKIGFYFLSLWLLFFSIIIITIDIPVYWGADWEFVGIRYLFFENIIPFACIVSLLIGCCSFYDFIYTTKGSSELSFKITQLENIEYEHLSFLTTYIIPLICFSFDNIRYIYVFIILLVVIGMIYIRTDLFYANPTLAILGFRIYKVKGSFRNDVQRDNIILITRDELHLNDSIKYITVDNRIYYAKKNNSYE